MIVLDVETTGLRDHDEILQISIIDGEYRTLLNRYYRPQNHREWAASQKIHGITPEQVADCPPVSADIDEIDAILAGADAVCGYNVQFDLRKIAEAGCTVPEDLPRIDVMHLFAPIYGDWNATYGEYRYKTLTDCAKYYGYTFPPHDSLEDVKATLFCYYKVTEWLSCHLTAEQEDAAATLSYYRLRRPEAAALFSLYDAGHDEAVALVDTRGENPLLSLIRRVGLPSWDWDCDFSKYPVSDDAFDSSPFTWKGVTYPGDIAYGDPVYYEKKDAALEMLEELAGQWRQSLDTYLSSLNERFGTTF